MKQDTYYQKFWMSMAKRALYRAKLYENAGLYDQSLKASELGNYCLKRHDKAWLKFMSAKRERTQQTAGTVFFLLVLAALIHLLIKHKGC